MIWLYILCIYNNSINNESNTILPVYCWLKPGTMTNIPNVNKPIVVGMSMHTTWVIHGVDPIPSYLFLNILYMICYKRADSRLNRMVHHLQVVYAITFFTSVMKISAAIPHVQDLITYGFGRRENAQPGEAAADFK